MPRCLAHALALALAVALLLPVSLSPAVADEPDQARVLEAVKAGKIKPLTEIIPIVRKSVPGEIIETEIEFEDGRWVYEFKTITPQGRRYEIYVDARTAKILRKKRE